MAKFCVRAGQPADFAAIMDIERGPGYGRLVATSSATEHESMHARPDVRYLVGVDADGRVRGFAILWGVGDLHDGVKLKRLAVAVSGEGLGRILLEEAMSVTFRELAAPRFWLDVFAHNQRARALYRRAGLREEGTLRGAYRLPDGQRADRVVMAILSHEWGGL